MTDMNIDIAEKLGWRKTDTWDVWVIPETAKLHLPGFTHSMDACVKYIVPELKKKYPNMRISYTYIGENITCSIIEQDTSSLAKQIISLGDGETEPLSFCKAFMEV